MCVCAQIPVRKPGKWLQREEGDPLFTEYTFLL
jgi:hypothetical protein